MAIFHDKLSVLWHGGRQLFNKYISAHKKENHIKFLIILNNLNANYYEQNFTLSITFTACFSK